MERVDSFWRLEGRSDRELLAELGTLVGTGRQLVAEVVAHLGEVEERRLHLDAGYGSMFAYCSVAPGRRGAPRRTGATLEPRWQTAASERWFSAFNRAGARKPAQPWWPAIWTPLATC
jgi:hypothetical protein